MYELPDDEQGRARDADASISDERRGARNSARSGGTGARGKQAGGSILMGHTRCHPILMGSLPLAPRDTPGMARNALDNRPWGHLLDRELTIIIRKLL